MESNAQKTFTLFGAICLMVMLPGAVQAQTCGSILTANTTLSANLVCPLGNGLVLAANNISLDCDGYTITGGGSGIGILLDNVRSATVANCRVDGFGVGFRIDGGSHNSLLDNIALNNQSTLGGFHIINESTNNWLERNISAFNVVGRGFSVDGSDLNVLLENVAYENGFRGFDIINSSNGLLYDNAAVNNWSAGIVVQDYLGGTSTGNSLLANYIEASGSEGLAMFASGNTVEWLISDNNGTWGIRDTSSGPANTYTSNTCAGNPSGTSSPLGLCF